MGSLLGDGTLLRTTSGYCFRVHHGLAQKALVDWKYKNLSAFVRSAPRICGRGYYFRTVSHPDFQLLRRSFYHDRLKSVPTSLLNEYLTPFAFAVWIMDDGASDGRQLRINTQSFTYDDCTRLTQLLRSRFDLDFSINTDKARPRLRCRSRSMPRLRELIAPHLLAEMRYKLPD